MSELPPRIEASEPEDEPRQTHLHEFDYEIKDWWCFNCNTMTESETKTVWLTKVPIRVW